MRTPLARIIQKGLHKRRQWSRSTLEFQRRTIRDWSVVLQNTEASPRRMEV
jgi:hypothetical protein